MSLSLDLFPTVKKISRFVLLYCTIVLWQDCTVQYPRFLRPKSNILLKNFTIDLVFEGTCNLSKDRWCLELRITSNLSVQSLSVNKSTITNYNIIMLQSFGLSIWNLHYIVINTIGLISMTSQLDCCRRLCLLDEKEQSSWPFNLIMDKYLADKVLQII